VVGVHLDLGLGFWQQERRLAGKQVDAIRGQNIPSNAKAIDRTVGSNCVVSHKSTDLRLPSYRKPSAVYATGTSHVRSLQAYKGEVRRDLQIKATYHLYWALEGPGARRMLEWFVPLNGLAPEQEHALQRVIAYGAARQVHVAVFRVDD
jgi:hypothetical protein